ncbi:hypothetical protein PALB_16360 [Pseudoalteromonas luteoviolacea B = ATCC 29581]|nr:hypothetical protein PALB_16360 [Pseudoalteromonas luteoviolacea B = ATCC 29581]
MNRSFWYVVNSVLFFIVCSFSVFSTTARTAIVVDVLSSENFSTRYQEFLDGKSPLDIQHFHPSTNGSHIEIIEMVLLQQALYLGGETRAVEFRPQPAVNSLEYDALIAGDSVLIGRSVWHQDIIELKGSLYVSEAIVDVGQYEAGLYVTKRNISLQDLPAERLDQITVVANPRWHSDWQALNNIDVNLISFIGPWETMLNMVENQVADAMLINFSVSESLSLNFEGREYVPIKNIKVLLPDSRHFVVSKRHPEGAVVAQALNKGLKILKERGVIERALRESGFINSQVKHWTSVNQHMLPSMVERESK